MRDLLPLSGGQLTPDHRSDSHSVRFWPIRFLPVLVCFLDRYVRVLVWCKPCRHRRDADLQALVDAGRGDVPLIHLRFRCSNCSGSLTDSVMTATEVTGRPR